MIALTLVIALLPSLLRAPQVEAAQAQQQPTDKRPRRAEPAPKGPAPTMQQPPAETTKDGPPVLRDPQGQEIGDDEVVKVDTNLVNLNVRVIDRLNRPINDVRQDDFRIFENGVQQSVAFFTREEVPINYGLVIDNSGSLRTQIDKVIEASKTIVTSNKTGDETFVVRFIDSDKIETVQDFTSNQTLLFDALEGLYVEGGATAILDAVYLSAERVAGYKKGNDLSDRRRRALILITDGEDRDSYYKQDQLFARLREEDVQIYVIGFVNELDKEGGIIRKSPREKAVNLLTRLAKETGGRVFFPTSLSELPQIATEITRDLRTQYVIGYNPTNKARDGSFRAVRVTIADAPGRDKRIALTRAGYNAPREGGATSTVQPASVKRP